MPQNADRNLVFAIIAWQNKAISENQLLSGIKAWAFEKDKPIEEIFVSLGILSTDQVDLLNRIAEAQIAFHGGNVKDSYDGLPGGPAVASMLSGVDDQQIEQCMKQIAEADPRKTTGGGVGATTTSGRFKPIRFHAKGGLGEVSIALDEELNREVALKEIQSLRAFQQDSQARFVLEAEITGGLEHPGIVPVYGFGKRDDGRPYYAMRFIRGRTLSKAIEEYHEADDWSGEQRRLKLRVLLGHFNDVCNAIAYAHSRGIVHRDIKPDNVMLGEYGESLVVDWGLALALKRTPDGYSGPGEPLTPPSSDQTKFAAGAGSPAYMPPEQFAADANLIGPKSDVYALGATLYEILTGVPPEKDSTVHGEPPKVIPPSEVAGDTVPAGLESICMKAISYAPIDRHATATELVQDIEAWLADEPVAQIKATVARFTEELESSPDTSAFSERLARELGTLSMVLLSLERREEALEAARNAVDVMKDAPYGTSREYVRVQQEYLYARQQVVRVLRQMGRDREAAAIKEESETELIEMIRQSQSKEVRDDLQSITIHFAELGIQPDQQQKPDQSTGYYYEIGSSKKSPTATWHAAADGERKSTKNTDDTAAYKGVGRSNSLPPASTESPSAPPPAEVETRPSDGPSRPTEVDPAQRPAGKSDEEILTLHPGDAQQAPTTTARRDNDSESHDEDFSDPGTMHAIEVEDESAPILDGSITVHPGHPHSGAVIDRIPDRYTVMETIGKGGISTVYLAVDNSYSMGRKVALKVAKQVNPAEHIFEKEAELLSKLFHPNILPVYDFGKTEGGAAYYTMPVLERRSLYERSVNFLDTNGHAVFVDGIRWLCDVCGAVDYVNSLGVLHRDVKPYNILFSGETPFLIDWGLSTRTNTSRSSDFQWEPYEFPAGSIVGTPGYVPPEMITNPGFDEETTDVYMLGATLYFSLTGAPPRRFDDMQQLIRIAAQPIPSVKSRNPSIPKPLAAICDKAVSVDPKDRFATANDLRHALSDWIDSQNQSSWFRRR